MLTIHIQNQEIEHEFHELVNFFGTEDAAMEEVFRFMDVYYAVFFREAVARHENDFHAILAELRRRVQASGRFAGMSHSDVLESLRNTREKVWEEDYQAFYEHLL